MRTRRTQPTRSRASRAPRALLALVAATAVGVTGGVTAMASASAATGTAAAGGTASRSVAQSTIPSAVPSVATPDVQNGQVHVISSLGSRVYLGGTFTSVAPHNSTVAVTRNYVMAFDATTGVIDAGFVPQVNGSVEGIAPGPRAGTVYLAGLFSTVNGVSMHLALVDAATGALVPGWAPPAMNGSTTSVQLLGTKLLVGGWFTKAGGKTHDGFVSMNPSTGALTSYLNVNVTGRHGTGSAIGKIGVKQFDVDPSGTHLIAIGNFVTAADATGTYPRQQIVMLDLGATSATIRTDWTTAYFAPQCTNRAFDSWVRDVKFSPDGSYFVVAATGGPNGVTNGVRDICDSASRWDTAVSGSAVVPTWVDYTGTDSLWSVAITGSAVYVGGHQRWMNNSFGHDSPASGALPRPGLAALDPVNGVPLSWNPGRNPRGAGAYAIYATDQGVYVGSDTQFIGNRKYKRGRIAFFPLTGGYTPPSTEIGTLPGRVFRTSGSSLTATTMSAAGAVGSPVLADSSMDWSQVRGAFRLGSTLYYGKADGGLYSRSFDGTTLGAESVVAPWVDAYWNAVPTGEGTNYLGFASGLSSELSRVTSMFYSGGRIYYTLSGSSGMYYRYFTPDGGAVGSDEFRVNDGLSWSSAAGAFVTGSTLYYATTDGVLHALAWSTDHASGSPQTVDTSQSWATRGMFVVAD